MATIGSLNLVLATSNTGLISGFKTAESQVASSSAKIVSSAQQIVMAEDKIAAHAKGVGTFGSGLLGPLTGMLSPILGIVGGIFAIGKALSAATDHAAAVNKLDAILQSTGNTTGFTSKQLQVFADDLQKVTNFGHDTTIAAEGVLASFKNISGDTFKQAVISAQDLTAAIGGDLQSNIFTIGQILQDPIMNMKKLKALGIDTTDTFKSQIAAMQQIGNIAGAQAAVLGQLQTKFGGVAQAAANPLTQLKNTLLNFAQGVGSVLLPIVGIIQTFLTPVLELISSLFHSVASVVTVVAGYINSAITTAFQAISDFVMPIWGAVTSFLSTAFAAAFDFIAPILAELFAVASTVFSAIVDAGMTLWSGLVGVFTSIGTFISDTFASIGVNSQTFIDLFTWLRTGVETALIAVEFAFQNWQALGELAFVGLEYGLVSFANTVVYWFTTALPGYISWFGQHWREVFTDVVNFTATVATNIWTNIKGLWDSIVGLFQGDGWDFKPTKLLEGYKSVITEMPKIAAREIGPVEQSLGDKFGQLGQQVGQSFNDFAGARMAALPGETNAFKGKFAGIGAAPKLAIAGVGPLGGATADNIAAGGGEKLGALVRGSKEAFQAEHGNDNLKALVSINEQQLDEMKTQTGLLGGDNDQIVDDIG